MHIVKDKPGLVKDPGSKAIINTDTKAFLAAKAAKKRIIESKEKQAELEERLSNLESLIDNMLRSEDGQTNNKN